MKTLLKIVIGIFILAVVAVGAAFYLTADMSDSADNFFLAITEKNYNGAYSFLSEDFRAGTTFDEFKNYIEQSALVNFKEASWTSMQRQLGGRGELDGSITTTGGGVIPLKLGFIKENNDWKIYSIHKPKAGLFDEDATGLLPSEEDQVELVHRTIVAFFEGTDAKDLSDFYENISSMFKRQLSLQDLEGSSEFWMGLETEVGPIVASLAPTFSGPTVVDDNKVMEITGYYPTTPERIQFTTSYIKEGFSWKLFGISLNLVNAE